jgi:hypothetical protein
MNFPTTLGQIVTVTLADGTRTPAYWDGVQWWVGLDDDEQDAPLVNEFVIAWE